MKKILIVFIILLSLSMISWGDVTSEPNNQTDYVGSQEPSASSTGSSHILIAYFSHTGNTRTIANQIHDVAGGDLFEIKTVDPYPEEYEAVVEIAKKELNEGYKPPLATHVENIDSYDVIFLGYPNWWGTMPMAVETFLTEHDLSGKTVIPFCTHNGSGLGSSVIDIKNLCPEATLLEGLAVRGSAVKDAQSQVAEWIGTLGITKE